MVNRKNLKMIQIEKSNDYDILSSIECLRSRGRHRIDFKAG